MDKYIVFGIILSYIINAGLVWRAYNKNYGIRKIDILNFLISPVSLVVVFGYYAICFAENFCDTADNIIIKKPTKEEVYKKEFEKLVK